MIWKRFENWLPNMSHMASGDEAGMAFIFANINGAKIYEVGKRSITTNINLDRKKKRLIARGRCDDGNTKPVCTTAV